MAGTRVISQDYPEIAPTGAPANDYQSINTTPNMFGGLIGQAEEKLGQGAENASNAAFSMAQFYSHTASNDALNSFMKGSQEIMSGDPNDPSKPGYLNTTGAAAMAGRAVAKQQLEDLYQKTLSAAPDPYTKQLIMENARRYQWTTGERIDDHANREFQTYATNTQKSLDDTFISNIGRDAANPGTYAQNLSDGALKIRDFYEKQGVSQDNPIFKDHFDHFMNAAIVARVQGWQNTDPVAAKAWLKSEYEAKAIDAPQYDTLLRGIEKPVGDAAANYETTRAATGQSPMPPATTPAAIRGVGDSYGARFGQVTGTPTNAVQDLPPASVTKIVSGQDVTNDRGMVAKGLTDADIASTHAFMLSSGAANSVGDAAQVKDQIDAFGKRNVTPDRLWIPGISPMIPGAAAANAKLEEIAKQTGAHFHPFSASDIDTDKIHPTAAALGDMAREMRGGDITTGPASNVDRSIPPEGRALLGTIGGPEAGGRYNVRYGGASFDGYGDHPRIKELITSGPNAGKTSDAAGRYQFLSSTWDTEKAKLGLKDFSPASQDKAAWDLAQTTYQKATGGDLLTALKSHDPATLQRVAQVLHSQWTSLPGGIEQGITGGKFAASYEAALQGKGPSSIASREPRGYNPPAATSIGGAGFPSPADGSGTQPPPVATLADATPPPAEPDQTPPVTPVAATSADIAPKVQPAGASSGAAVAAGMVASAEQLRDVALYNLMRRTDLSDGEKNYGREQIQRTYQTAQITAEATRQAKAEKNSDAADKVIKRMLTGDYPTPDEIANNPDITNPDTRLHLGELALKHANGGKQEATEMYGPNFWDMRKAIVSPPPGGTIPDTNQILAMAQPGGGLTLDGAQELLKTQAAMKKSVDDRAVEQAKDSFLTYAKGKISFEQDTGIVKIRDPKGEEYFHSEFLPKFMARFDKFMQKPDANPWDFLNKKNIDEMIAENPRSAKQMQQDRMSALGETAGEPANAPTTPAPPNVNADAWNKVAGAPPMGKNGPVPHAVWGSLLSNLVADPKTYAPMFDASTFGKTMRAADLLKQFGVNYDSENGPHSADRTPVGPPIAPALSAQTPEGERNTATVVDAVKRFLKSTEGSLGRQP